MQNMTILDLKYTIIRIDINCTILTGIIVYSNAFIIAKRFLNIDIPKKILAYGSQFKKKLTKRIIDYGKIDEKILYLRYLQR